MSRKSFQITYWITMFLLFLTVIFPVFGLANKETPIILGLPFSFFWVGLWVFITFLAVLIFYLIDPDNNTRGG